MVSALALDGAANCPSIAVEMTGKSDGLNWMRNCSAPLFGRNVMFWMDVIKIVLVVVILVCVALWGILSVKGG